MATDTTSPVRDRERLARDYTAEEMDILDSSELALGLRASHRLDTIDARGTQKLIGGLIRVAADLARDFADRHDAACSCGDCSPRVRFCPAVWDEEGERAAQRRNHVIAGAAFTLEMLSASVEGVTPDEFRADGETWAADLKALLDLEVANAREYLMAAADEATAGAKVVSNTRTDAAYDRAAKS